MLALDGREPISLPWLGTPKKKDIKDHRNRVIAKVLLYPVGLYEVKTAWMIVQKMRGRPLSMPRIKLC
ncbi:hypothetical protein [Rhizobium rhizogenes]|uniref:hypothetical protein n=1 Tax=Rhizobium rhizogenes TaxID=359 RepID=UPI0022C739D7|nr:hypothetical protein [Rhizobium rhizogenes]MCZ7481022.1 hypothetical protein [Rhizobium rhizogenes]